eukprot:6435753-Lingulodinium_polyedra.AAC.1
MISHNNPIHKRDVDHVFYRGTTPAHPCCPPPGGNPPCAWLPSPWWPHGQALCHAEPKIGVQILVILGLHNGSSPGSGEGSSGLGSSRRLSNNCNCLRS